MGVDDDALVGRVDEDDDEKKVLARAERAGAIEDVAPAAEADASKSSRASIVRHTRKKARGVISLDFRIPPRLYLA